VDSEPRPSRPPTSRNDNVIDQVRTLIMQDHRITVQDLAVEVGVSTGYVHSILAKDLGLKRLSANLAAAITIMHPPIFLI
jgi:AraC-like DNA-binding protein